MEEKKNGKLNENVNDDISDNENEDQQYSRNSLVVLYTITACIFTIGIPFFLAMVFGDLLFELMPVVAVTIMGAFILLDPRRNK